jgi:predicted esterase
MVLTDRLRAGGGGAVLAAQDFLDVTAASDSTDADLRHARTVLAPLRTWLATDGDASHVIDATQFTTQDATGLMAALRRVVFRPCGAGEVFPACVPPPVASGVTLTQSASNFDVYEGTYPGPNFETGSPPYLTPADGGEILVDANGDPIPQRMEDLRFAVAVPTGGPAVWPIVLYAHGTGGNYRSFIDDGTAGRMAAQGLATIGIDQVLHGPRDPTGSDPSLTFFNFQNPLSTRDNIRQAGADNFQLERLVAALDVAGNTFDPARTYFMGHSQGGLTGPPFLAYEPMIKGAVLSGAGGLLYLTLLHGPQTISAVVSDVDRDYPLDEFDPIVSMVQAYAEPSDPENYGPLLLREPPSGVEPKNLYQSEGFLDSYVPQLGMEAFAVSIGESPVTPIISAVDGFRLRGLSTLDPPVSNNAGDRTAVFLQYNALPNDDGHFVVFDVPAAQKQHAAFLGTLAATGTATLVAP